MGLGLGPHFHIHIALRMGFRCSLGTLGRALPSETVDALLFWRRLCVTTKSQGPHLQTVNSGLSICPCLNSP